MYAPPGKQKSQPKASPKPASPISSRRIKYGGQENRVHMKQVPCNPNSSEDPHIEEQEEDGADKAKPNPPPNASLLSHAEHTLHIPA
jgi:hypothetical protein